MQEQSQRKNNENTIIQNPFEKLLTTLITSLAYKLLSGVAVVKLGDEINIDGIGSTHGGTYYVDEVTHVFTKSGYRQRFKLTRNSTNAEQEGDLE